MSTERGNTDRSCERILYSNLVGELGLERDDLSFEQQVEAEVLDLMVGTLRQSPFFREVFGRGGKTIGDPIELGKPFPNDVLYAVSQAEELLVGVLINTPTDRLGELEKWGNSIGEASKNHSPHVQERIERFIKDQGLLDLQERMQLSHLEAYNLELSATGL